MKKKTKVRLVDRHEAYRLWDNAEGYNFAYYMDANEQTEVGALDEFMGVLDAGVVIGVYDFPSGVGFVEYIRLKPAHRFKRSDR